MNLLPNHESENEVTSFGQCSKGDNEFSEKETEPSARHCSRFPTLVLLCSFLGAGEVLGIANGDVHFPTDSWRRAHRMGKEVEVTELEPGRWMSGDCDWKPA